MKNCKVQPETDEIFRIVKMKELTKAQARKRSWRVARNLKGGRDIKYENHQKSLAYFSHSATIVLFFY